VVRQFSAVATIAHNHPDFIAACYRTATRPDQAAIARGVELARKNSWESIVRKLERHIQDAICRTESIAISAA
jgi:hypothetical protein